MGETRKYLDSISDATMRAKSALSKLEDVKRLTALHIQYTYLVTTSEGNKYRNNGHLEVGLDSDEGRILLDMLYRHFQAELDEARRVLSSAIGGRKLPISLVGEDDHG